MNANEISLTLAQLKRDIMNGTPFMFALSHSKPIRLIMRERGYTMEEHRLGWRMLFQLMSHRRPWDEDDGMSAALKEVVAEVDRWDNSSFAYARAALEHHFPEQAAYIFKDLRAKYGAQSILVVKTFLERVKILREGLDPHREASREADLAAARLLEERNIVDPEIEARLNELIERSMDLSPEPEEEADPFAMDEAAYLELADTFHAWLKDWRQTARAAIKNRNHLIRLGLTRPRKQRKSGVAPVPGDGSANVPDGGGSVPAPDGGLATGLCNRGEEAPDGA